jgi:hypothetical protein
LLPDASWWRKPLCAIAAPLKLSKPDMDTPSPPADFLLEKIEIDPRLILKFWEN